MSGSRGPTTDPGLEINGRAPNVRVMSSIQILTRLMVSLSFVALSLVWGSDAFAVHSGGSYSRLMSRDQSIRAFDRQRIELNQERSFNQARERDIIRNRDSETINRVKI